MTSSDKKLKDSINKMAKYILKLRSEKKQYENKMINERGRIQKKIIQLNLDQKYKLKNINRNVMLKKYKNEVNLKQRNEIVKRELQFLKRNQIAIEQNCTRNKRKLQQEIDSMKNVIRMLKHRSSKHKLHGLI